MGIAISPFQIDSRVSDFIEKPRKMLIGGKWVNAASGKTFPTYNPATGEVLAQIAEGDRQDIDAAVKAARKAFDSGPWPRMTTSERGRLIWKLADLLEEHTEEFATLETLDNGKPLAVARAADVPLTVDMFRYMAGWATKLEGTTIPISVPYTPKAKYLAYTLREPVGVVGQIIPWNFPLLMAGWKLGPALAAGCTDGVVNIVPGYGETAGAALAAHDLVDKIAFTGSTEVGRLIVHAATGNLKKVSLELGGKSPNVVFKDADMDTAIPGAASSIFFNHGQCCCAGSRLYVEKSVFDKVVDGVAEQAKKIRVGPGLDSKTQMGPLVSVEQLDRVCSYLESGLSQGAKAIAGGHKSGDKGYFVEPTVLVNTSDDMKVVQEEIFGPVVAAMPFTDPDEIIPRANDNVYGLAAGVWTRDISKAHRMAEQLQAGTVWINCYNIFDAGLPFGGYKQSGWGREMGHEVLNNYTQTKAVCARI